MGSAGGRNDGTALPGHPTDATLYRLAFESFPGGVIVVDPRGTIVMANDEIDHIFGYPRAELIGQSIQLLVPENRRAAHAAEMARFPRHDTDRLMGLGRNLKGRRRDGSEVPLEIGLRSVDTDDGVFVLASVVDITSRARYSAALQESETRYRLLSETSFDGISISEEGILREVNGGFAKMLGRSPDELVGKPIADLIADESRDEVARHLRDEKSGRYQFFAVHADGRRLRLEATFDTYRIGDREQRVTAVRDMTEKHNLERQYLQSQKMEAVGRLAGGVAHDFNNLLTVISSYASLLLEGDALSAPVRDDLAEIGKAADSAATLTRQLLAFSRKQVLEPKAIDLNAVVRDAEKMLRRVIGEDIELTTSLAAGLGPVMADFGQIEQVIMNMAVNARDAMPEGGLLTIETTNVDLESTEIGDHGAVKAGRYVMLAINDSGAGMDDETKTHIFEPFFTTKEAGRGTGLGLSMVYGIVKQSGGYIWVFSEPGKGTTFKICLPRIDATAQPVKAAPVGDAGRGRETVLLVEDVAALREIERRVLEGKGYRVIEAADAQKALSLAGAFVGPIHLLLADVVLPGMGGRELAEQLHGSRPELRVLFTSGYTDDSVMRRGIQLGGVAFLQKPFAPEALVRKVRDVLDAVAAAGTRS
ncbi:MAG: PAS domain S-box protein [Gemmatimonadales bacterium]